MSFKELFLSKYKETLFTRYDEDGSVFYFSPSDFPGLSAVEYSFTNNHGERLKGYFYNYDAPIENRIVIFEHGLGGGHRAYMREIELLARHGYLVYSYDRGGCMESEGETTHGFSASLSDLDACIRALKADENYKGYSISVVGHSWGGFSTMNISAIHNDVQHAVAISGFSSVNNIHKQITGTLFASMRKYLYDVEYKANPDYVDFSAIENLKTTSTKTLIIHSNDDKVVKCSHHFKRLRKAAKKNQNVYFLLVKGKGHNPNYTFDAVKYKDAFFKELTKKKKLGLLNTEEQKAAFRNSYDWRRMTEQDEHVWDVIFEMLAE